MRPLSVARHFDGDSRDRYLEAAARIGADICAKAVWSGEACTWVVPGDLEDRAYEAADGSIYSGSAGVALFLAELHALTGEPVYAKTARAAAVHADGAAGALRAHGLHTGRPGVVYALAKIGALFAEDRWLRCALSHARISDEGQDEPLDADIVMGAAGSILALLALFSVVRERPLLERAADLGRQLVACARQEPFGWSWDVPVPVRRNLTGFAHGAAGITSALLELYLATGNEELRFAARQGQLYERHFWDRTTHRWPDLRVEVTAGRAGARAMNAWCHGAPGIGLSRVHAWGVLADPVCLEEVRSAVAATIHHLEDRTDCSLCHGLFGRCEFLLQAADCLEAPDLRRRTVATADEALQTYGEEPDKWPCGTSGLSSPDLMRGTAGIGHFLLRLYRPDRVASVLLVRTLTPRPPTNAAVGDSAHRGEQEMLRTYADQYFRRTRRILERLGIPLGHPAMHPIRSAPEQTFEAICGILDDRTGAERDLLVDASTLDRARYTAMLTDEWLYGSAAVASPGSPERNGTAAIEYQLAPGVGLCNVAFDWDQWLTQSMEGLPRASPAFFVLAPGDGRVSERRIGRLDWRILRFLEQSATATAVVRALFHEVQPQDAIARNRFAAFVAERIATYHAGGVLVARPV